MYKFFPSLSSGFSQVTIVLHTTVSYALAEEKKESLAEVSLVFAQRKHFQYQCLRPWSAFSWELTLRKIATSKKHNNYYAFNKNTHSMIKWRKKPQQTQFLSVHNTFVLTSKLISFCWKNYVFKLFIVI